MPDRVAPNPISVVPDPADARRPEAEATIVEDVDTYSDRPTPKAPDVAPEAPELERAMKAEQQELDARVAAINPGPEDDAVAEPRRLPVVSPSSRRYLAFLVVLALLGTYSVAVAAYELAFPAGLGAAFRASLVVDWLIDLVFVGGALANFHLLGYFEEGAVVLRPSRWRYGRSWLACCELLGCLPLDVFQAATGWHPGFRANKLLRVVTVRASLNALQASTTRPRLINSLHVVKLVLLWLIMPHIAATGRLLLARERAGDGWEPTDAVRAEPDSVQYLHALYWCLGLMTGYADGAVPETAGQALFTLGLINLGIFSFAYTVGVLGLMGGSERRRAHDLRSSLS